MIANSVRDAIVLLIAALIASGSAKAQVFSKQIVEPLTIDAETIATADFNRDGRTDLVVGSRRGGLSLLLGNSDAMPFSSPIPQACAAPFAVGDFNNDNKPDLVCVINSVVAVLLGNGDGTFQESYNTPGTVSLPTTIIVADFNGDGRPDVAVGDQGASSVLIFLGNGDGTFLPQMAANSLGEFVSSMAVGDFNSDGILDLVANNAILLGNGDGTFRTPFPFTGEADSVTVGDFNADGKLDIAVLNNSFSSLSQNVVSLTVLLGDGQGGFAASFGPSASNGFGVVGPGDSPLAAGDFNGDGKLDLAITNLFSDNISVFLGDGTGSFQQLSPLSVGRQPTSLVSFALSQPGANTNLAVVDVGCNSSECGPPGPPDVNVFISSAAPQNCLLSSNGTFFPGSAGPTGLSSTFTLVFNASGCQFSVSSDSPWLVLNPTAGTAAGTNISIAYTIAPNADTTPRTAALTVTPGYTAGTPYVLYVNQNSSSCTFTLSPPTITVPAPGGESTPLNIFSSPAGCWWFFGVTPPWINAYTYSNISNGGSLATPISFNFFADANNGPPRSFIVQSDTDPPSPATFTIYQAGTSGALQVSPTSLSFTGISGGPPPGPQSISISSTTGDPFPFAVSADDGFGRPAPQWLTISSTGGTTPGSITVFANPLFLGAGSYSARIIVNVINDPTQQPIDVAVMFTVTGGSPKLDVSPTFLSFRSTAQTPGVLQQVIVVRNVGGGGADSFSVSILNPIKGLTVSTTSGQAQPGSPVFVQVNFSPSGLAPGGYRGLIRFTSSDAVIDVSVSVFIASAGPILAVDQTGINFEYRLKQGQAIPKTVAILNLGNPSSTVSFNAEFVNATPWLALSPTTGTSTAAQPGSVSLTVVGSEADNLTPGSHYALIRISDPNSQNSPQYITVAVDVSAAETSAPEPDPSPSGLVFVGTAGAAPPPAQQVQIYTSSSAPVNFQVSAPTANGSPFVSLSLAGGTLTTQTPAALSVTANTMQLSAGVYQGNITIAIGTVQRSVNVTVIVVPASAASSASRQSDPMASCTPQQLVLTLLGLTNTFSVRGGFPEPLSVIMNDNCGNSIANGQAVATFSNGDPAFVLPGDGTSNRYSATWQPVAVSQQMTITIQGTAGGLAPASAQITGQVNQNPNPAPVVNQTVNQLYPAGGLSPGLVAQVYGLGLASTTAYTNTVPVPPAYKGTSVLVGNRYAPLMYTSDGRVDIQIPSELKPGQYPILVNMNGALSVGATITLNPTAPGIATSVDGEAIATAFTFVNRRNPAKPGDIITVYLVGMGTTKPAVASGHPPPSIGPLPGVTVTPVVTLDGQKTKVLFAGLTRFGVGLYQIVFQVPLLARTGDLVLAVSQNGIPANIAKIAVKR